MTTICPHVAVLVNEALLSLVTEVAIRGKAETNGLWDPALIQDQLQ
jgi:hypothetical protein